MLKKTIEYLMNNREVFQLVNNGQACLVGVSPSQQKAIVEVIGEKTDKKVKPLKYWWD